MATTKQQFSEINPPDTTQVEIQVISDIITRNDLYPAVIDMMDISLFNDKNCIQAFRTIEELYQQHKPFDIVTLYGKIDKSIIDHSITAPMSATGEHALRARIETLKELNLKRILYFSCVQGLRMISDSETTTEQFLEFPNWVKNELSQTRESSSSVKPLNELVYELGNNISDAKASKIKTGIPSLDAIFEGGYESGQLIVIGARPGVGKTALALQMARAAASDNHNALFITMEMTGMEISKRMVLSTGIISAWQLDKETIDYKLYDTASAELNSLPIYIEERAMTLASVIRRLRLTRAQGRCDIAFIDYLQLMTANKEDTYYVQVTEMTRSLKALALELQIPIVLLSQLNRTSDNDHRSPRLSDLKESGSIEQDANKVLLMERYMDVHTQQLTNMVKLWVAKNREGQAGMYLWLKAENSYTKFIESNNEVQL